MNCFIHNDREAVGACAYCGKMFCQECLVDISGRNYCKEHVSHAFNNQQPNYQQQPNIYINNTNMNNNGMMISNKSRLLALLLCVFFGAFGIHRFYVGKIGSGLLYLFTFGLCGIGALIDFILILTGGMSDNFGMPITRW